MAVAPSQLAGLPGQTTIPVPTMLGVGGYGMPNGVDPRLQGGVVSSQEVPPAYPPANPGSGVGVANPAFADTTAGYPNAPTPAQVGEPPAPIKAPVPTPLPPWPGLHLGKGDGSTPTAPTPPGVDHPALINPDQQYVDQFNAHIGSMRQSIDNAFAANSQSLSARRDQAAAYVATLPGIYDRNFKAAVAHDAGIDVAAATGIHGRSAVGGGGVANANTGTAHALLANTNQAAHDTVPMLNMGVNANYGAGLTSLQNTRDTGLQGVDQTAAQFDASQASQASSQAASQNAANQSLTNQEKLLQWEAQNGTGKSALTVSDQIALNKVASGKGYTDVNGMAQANKDGPKLADFAKTNGRAMTATNFLHNTNALAWLKDNGFLTTADINAAQANQKK